MGMHVLIIGAAGMIGRKLTAALTARGELLGQSLDQLTLVDIVAPGAPSFAGKVTCFATDLMEAEAATKLASSRPDVIFHLAAIVSGEAEANFEKGYLVNLHGTLGLFEAIRLEGLKGPYCPRLVFTSSIAVYGTPLPELIQDTYLAAPLTSYGTQKAACELLLADYSRRGFFDGIGIRLPTISIRPGRPNQAASGFFSSILREPLVGEEAVLPVEECVRHWFASPRTGVSFLIHAAEIDTTPLGSRRSLNMPGLSATVGEQIEALRHIAGEKAVKLIRREPDPAIAGMVAGWPQNFDPRRAVSLGFKAEKSFNEIIQVHIEDELDGILPK